MEWKEKLLEETKEKIRLVKKSDLPEEEKYRRIVELARELGKKLLEEGAVESSPF
ncbi:MAG: hypothetical protein K6U74_08920 [Firmicutes bacterium]|nr:hypothetical protein [Bacillota bacterium]